MRVPVVASRTAAALASSSSSGAARMSLAAMGMPSTYPPYARFVSDVTVEEVGKGFAFRLFTDLGRGQLLDRFGPRAEWLLAVQRKRLAVRPKEDSALLLARRAGRPVARLAVHVRHGDEDGR